MSLKNCTSWKAGEMETKLTLREAKERAEALMNEGGH
jgi:hypothetical protein